MMLCVANRKDGNTKNCSQPLAAYEDGAENYWNLSKTIYHKDSPVKKFLQELLDDRLHTVVVMTKNQSGKIAESRSTVLSAIDWQKKGMMPRCALTVKRIDGAT
jgi:hypothetical protein